MPDYRTRLLATYVHGRTESLAPATIDGLRPRAPYLRRLVREHFPPDRSAEILDLGCGHGALIHFAREAGYGEIRGVDASPQQVEAARRLGIPDVQQGDVRGTLAELEPDSLDAVIAFDLIEHLTRSELFEVADGVRRALRPGGRWIIHTPNGQSPFFGGVRYGDLTHELAFTPLSLEQLVLSSGFTGIACYEDAPVVHGAKSLLRLALWRAIRTTLRICIAAETGDSGGGRIFSQNLLAVVVK